MKDQLLDIVQHTHGLGVIDLVKVVGTDSETNVNAIAEDRSVIVEAKFNGPVSEFVGTFGMPNLGKLNTILNITEYKEDAELSITKKKDAEGNDQPDGIHFENKVGDFKNDYRFMSANVVNDKLKTVKFKGVKWGVEVSPTNLSIQRLKFQASANSEETTFIAKTHNGELKFYFGDHSSHAGDFTFAIGVTGSLSKAWSWPINVVISILSLPGDKILRISDEGAAQITVDSGIAVWNYTIPAQTK
jgi:hypothetical protein